MLTEILQALRGKESVSVMQLAGTLKCSVGQIQSMLEQLERMGYIRRSKAESSCNPSVCGLERGGSHCSGCSMQPAEAVPAWELTERGKNME